MLVADMYELIEGASLAARRYAGALISSVSADTISVRLSPST